MLFYLRTAFVTVFNVKMAKNQSEGLKLCLLSTFLYAHSLKGFSTPREVSLIFLGRKMCCLLHIYCTNRISGKTAITVHVYMPIAIRGYVTRWLNQLFRKKGSKTSLKVIWGIETDHIFALLTKAASQGYLGLSLLPWPVLFVEIHLHTSYSIPLLPGSYLRRRKHLPIQSMTGRWKSILESIQAW